ncbi:hypothetical protein [Nonomuraea sediminis]|uniref:hypothetical protein n=1 Tax=Nonomuraea sediminis TaxID=2835864 RepID=UPI001BDDC885|nr:hypothetical protein [Nonomuraea sediminis]
MTLGDAYRQLDQDAHNYADAGKVIRLRSRRRTRRALAAGSIAALVVVGGVAVQQRLSRPPAVTATVASPAIDPPAETPTVVSPVIDPPAAARSLPPGKVGARGVLVYAACQYGCPTYLVLADGRQYELDERIVDLSLSPDGRWLGHHTENGYELRDLLGGTAEEIPAPQDRKPNSVLAPWAWSADSRLLLLGDHVDGDVSTYLELDLATGTTTGPALPSGQEPVGILPSGDLLLLDESQYRKRPLTRVTLTRGDHAVTLTSDAGALADTDHGLSIQVSGDRVFTLAYAEQATTVLEFDTTGKLVTRTQLPPDEYPVGPVPGGYAVTRIPQDQKNGRQRLESLTPSGRRLLFDLLGEAAVVLPGAARH